MEEKETSLSSKWKEDSQEIETNKRNSEPILDEVDWKVVGSHSHSRTESLSIRRGEGGDNSNNAHDQQNTMMKPSSSWTTAIRHPMDNVIKRSSSISSIPDNTNKQWYSFDGLQWEGNSSILKEEDMTGNNSILSVPMLPSVPLEPTYRHQRSFSFSTGQESNFFGYEDYNNSSNSNRLAPTLEEDDENLYFTNSSGNIAFNSPFSSYLHQQQQQQHMYSNNTSFTRARSQSSNAVFGGSPVTPMIPNTTYWNNNIRPNSIRTRRSSFGEGFMPTNLLQLQQQYENQRRMPQPVFMPADYSFPSSNGATLAQNRPYLVNNNNDTTATLEDNMTQLIERLENTNIGGQSSQSKLPFISGLLPPDIPVPNSTAATTTSGTTIPTTLDNSINDIVEPLTPISSTSTTATNDNSTGKGIYIHRLPPHVPLYMIEFKSGRTDFYYLSDSSNSLTIQENDLVIVEADRGEDLGKVATKPLTIDKVLLLRKQQHKTHNDDFIISEDDNAATSTHQQQQSSRKNEIHVKKIHRKAGQQDIHQLLIKEQDEQNALALCLQRVKHKKMPMEVVDAEFQWDRRKLTFYFIAEKRIDFRDLVRELFKTYKTRIWMCAVANPSSTIGCKSYLRSGGATTATTKN